MENIVTLTGSRFIMAAALDTRRLEFSSTAFYGAIDERLLDGFRDYQDHYYKLDPMVRHAKLHPLGRHVSSAACFAEDGFDYLERPYVRWSIGALGSARWNLAYSAPLGEFTFGAAIHPGPEKAGHASNEVALFRMLFDHLEQAARLAARPPDLLGEREAALAINRYGRVIALSERARALLARDDGLFIADGRLTSAARAMSSRIDRALVSALAALEEGSAGGALQVERPSGRRAFAVTVTPMIGGIGVLAAFQPAALVRIVDLEDGPGPDAGARWAALYGLTPAEVRLSLALLQGEGNLRETAERLGVAYATARVQLARVFDKAGVGSQAQLARLLTRS